MFVQEDLLEVAAVDEISKLPLNAARLLEAIEAIESMVHLRNNMNSIAVQMSGVQPAHITIPSHCKMPFGSRVILDLYKLDSVTLHLISLQTVKFKFDKNLQEFMRVHKPPGLAYSYERLKQLLVSADRHAKLKALISK